jgi:hypothetical protein
MKPIVTTLTVAAVMTLSTAFANASHAPGSRRAVITGDDTVDTSCKQYGWNGSCIEK